MRTTSAPLARATARPASQPTPAATPASPWAAACRALGAAAAAASLSALLASGKCGEWVTHTQSEPRLLFQITNSFLTTLFKTGAAARLEGVNKPDLLPLSYIPVIDVAGFLTPGEEARIAATATALEKDTGLKLRVLAQNYPETPGLAIVDFWGVDDDTVVCVADPSLSGNILNFNVGAALDLKVPQAFWSRLAGKYGTRFYWRDNGEAASILNAVNAIDVCAREPVGRGQCVSVAAPEE